MPEPGASPSPAEGRLETFQYALLRVVPRVERGERLNVGVVLYCRAREFLAARIEPDDRRLLALDSGLDLDAVHRHLEFVRRVAAGDTSCGALGSLALAERFGWLVAPSSTIVQPSEVHTGLTDDPTTELDRLFEALVR